MVSAMNESCVRHRDAGTPEIGSKPGAHRRGNSIIGKSKVSFRTSAKHPGPNSGPAPNLDCDRAWQPAQRAGGAKPAEVPKLHDRRALERMRTDCCRAVALERARLPA